MIFIKWWAFYSKRWPILITYSVIRQVLWLRMNWHFRLYVLSNMMKFRLFSVLWMTLVNKLSKYKSRTLTQREFYKYKMIARLTMLYLIYLLVLVSVTHASAFTQRKVLTLRGLVWMKPAFSTLWALWTRNLNLRIRTNSLWLNWDWTIKIATIKS